ncbi:hypothetical protein ACG7TL_006375 [Trametes sanguinea]
MATTVCETALHPHQLHNDHASSQQAQGRYRWPSFDSFLSVRSKSRPSTLRVVSSEAAPMPAQKSATPVAAPPAPGPGVRASSSSSSNSSSSRDASSSATSHAAEAVRQQARLPEASTQSPKPQTHVRARSTTAVGEPSDADSSAAQATIPPHPHPRHRARAASSAAAGSHPSLRPRPRIPSMLSSIVTPGAPVRAQKEDSESLGSFIVTGSDSTRQSLLNVLSPRGAERPRTYSSLPASSRAALRLTLGRFDGRAPSERRLPVSTSSPIDPPSTTIPSICRTPSSYTGSEYFPTAPSSAGPATPVHTVATLPVARKSESLHPVLEGLEQLVRDVREARLELPVLSQVRRDVVFAGLSTAERQA